jgi:3',5'-nucleoside bisphosphate phosphatase
LAQAHAVRVIALTDHDTIDGVSLAQPAADAHKMRLITGIEVSSVFNGKEVHVLGYGLHPDAAVRTELAALRGTRVARAQKVLAKLQTLAKPIAFERVAQLAGDGMIGRPHIARAMIEAGYVASVDEAFQRYLAEGMPAHVPNDTLTPAQAVDLIHRARGCAVLAHPGLFRGELDVLFEHLIDAGLDGIEAYYPDHTPKFVARCEAHARAHGLICTGGSDFHRVLSDGAVTLATQRLPRGTIETLDDRMARYSAHASSSSSSS